MKDPIQIRDLHDNDWLGIVVNNKDPLFAGRCQVRVFSVMDDLIDDLLPWAIPSNSTVFGSNGAGSVSVPKIGHFIRVIFTNGDIYSPEYTTIQNLDPALINKIKDDYDGTHVIVYDQNEDLNVIYQRNSGFLIYYKESLIQITPDSMITIQHANNDSIIQLVGDKCNVTTKNEVNITASSKVNIVSDESILNGKQSTKLGPNAQFHAVLAEPLWAMLSTLASAIDTKYPLSPGVNTSIVQSTKSAATSNNVTISK